MVLRAVRGGRPAFHHDATGQGVFTAPGQGRPGENNPIHFCNREYTNYIRMYYKLG